MAYSRTRARDTDRDRAIEFVGAAFSDGQLSRAEHDERVAKLQVARTFADLDAQLFDLQKPGESNWRVPASASAPTPMSKRAVLIAAVAVAVTLGLGVVLPRVISTNADDVSNTPISKVPVEEPDEPITIKDPRTAAGYADFLTAMEAKLGTTKMTSAYLSENSVTLTIPVSPEKGRRYVTWSWDGEWSEYATGKYADHAEVWSLDLKTIDSSKFAAAMELSLGRVEDAESASFAVQPDGKTCYNIYVENRFDESFYGRFACNGKLIKDS